MGPGVVVMIDELLEDGLEMAGSEDDDVIEHFSADGADPAVAGLLCNPFAGGVGGYAREMDATGTDFDGEEDVELTEPGGVHGEEVDGKDGVGVGANELAPGHPAAPRGRWYPVAA